MRRAKRAARSSVAARAPDHRRRPAPPAVGRCAAAAGARQGAQVAQRGAADVLQPVQARPRRGSRASGSASSCERAWAGSAPAGRRAVRGAAPAARRRRRWAPCPATPASPVPATWRRPGAQRAATEELQAGAHAQQHGGLVGQRDLGVYCSRASAAPCSASASACGLRGSSSTWGAMAAAPARRMSIRTPARRAAGVRAITRSCSSTAYAWASSGQCGRMASSGRQRRQAAIQRRMAGGCFEGAGLQAPCSGVSQAGPGARIWMDSPPGAGQRQPQGAAWRGRRRRTDAGRRTAGRWPGPPDAAGAAIRDGPGAASRAGAAAAVPEDLLGGPERVRRFSGQTQSNCRGSSRQLIQVTILGACGGCTSAIGRRVSSWDRAGRSRRISPTPGCGDSSSTRLPIGQPPSGSSADSAACPVGRQRAPRASWSGAPQAGWMRSGTAWRGGRGARRVAVYYCINIQHMAPVRRNLMRLNLDGRLPMIPRNPTSNRPCDHP